MIEVGHHSIFQIYGISFHFDTIVSLFLVSLIIITLAIVIRFSVLRGFHACRNKISLSQTAVELCLDSLKGIPTEILGERGLPYVPFISTLFIFILFCNLFGLLPVNAFYELFLEKSFGHIPELSAPTANINITGGLAVFVFFASHYFLVSSVE